MDVLNPSLINIDGRIYCVNSSSANYNCNELSEKNSSPAAGEYDHWEDEPACEVEATCNVEKNANGRLVDLTVKVRGTLVY